MELSQTENKRQSQRETLHRAPRGGGHSHQAPSCSQLSERLLGYWLLRGLAPGARPGQPEPERAQGLLGAASSPLSSAFLTRWPLPLSVSMFPSALTLFLSPCLCWAQPSSGAPQSSGSGLCFGSPEEFACFLWHISPERGAGNSTPEEKVRAHLRSLPSFLDHQLPWELMRVQDTGLEATSVASSLLSPWGPRTG